jgi:hypothetical protein
VKVVCPYCGRDAVLVKGTVIYPHRQDLYSRNFWQCAPCDAYVGTHRRNKKHKLNGDEPLGRLANKELRREKVAAHAAFDPLWVTGAMPRRAAYEWLAAAIDVPFDECHIGLFDVDACRSVVVAVENRRATK